MRKTVSATGCALGACSGKKRDGDGGSVEGKYLVCGRICCETELVDARFNFHRHGIHPKSLLFLPKNSFPSAYIPSGQHDFELLRTQPGSSKRSSRCWRRTGRAHSELPAPVRQRANIIRHLRLLAHILAAVIIRRRTTRRTQQASRTGRRWEREARRPGRRHATERRLGRCCRCFGRRTGCLGRRTCCLRRRNCCLGRSRGRAC